MINADISQNNFFHMKFLHSIKLKPHFSLLTNIIKRFHNDEEQVEIPLTCSLSNKFLIHAVRNKQCKHPKCVFELNEEFSKYFSNNVQTLCPSCLQFIQRDNFVICTQTETILSFLFTQKLEEIQEFVYLDWVALTKNELRSPENFLILKKQNLSDTLPLPKISSKTSLESQDFSKILDSPKSQASISRSATTLKNTPPRNSNLFYDYSTPKPNLNELMLQKSVTLNLVSSPTRENKWNMRARERHNTIASPSPGSRVNKWNLRKRGSISPPISPDRVNKWQNRKLTNIDLNKLLRPVSQCKANYMKIKMRDTYQKNSNMKFLHYFQEKTKYLHIVDLFDLFDTQQKSYTKPLSFQTIKLHNEFVIPESHASIADDFGDIYLIGGFQPAKNYKEVNTIFVYDSINQQLVKRGNLNIPRSGHTLVNINEHIYIIGGYYEERTLRSCERFNSMTGKCETLAELKTEVAYACVVNYNNKYLYKFGGRVEIGKLDPNIERYDIKANIWEQIFLSTEMKKMYKPTCMSAGVQINDREIYVFGGCYEFFGEKSSNSFIFKVEGFEKQLLGNIKGVDRFPLPISERFDCNNQVIIYDNHMFCLQNLVLTKKQVKDGDFAKRVMICNQDAWILIN